MIRHMSEFPRAAAMTTPLGDRGADMGHFIDLVTPGIKHVRIAFGIKCDPVRPRSTELGFRKDVRILCHLSGRWRTVNAKTPGTTIASSERVVRFAEFTVIDFGRRIIFRG